MNRELALEVVRVTEGAALAAASWLGRGDKMSADGAATNAMRSIFDSVNMKGKVVIGEGEMDEAPMLYIGEELGTGEGPEVDIAVDPIEGTNIVAKGYSNAITVLAIADKGTLLHAPDMYMEKIAVGSVAAGKININDPIETTIDIVAQATKKRVQDLTVMVLERERHQELIERIRQKGARVKLFSDNDISAAIATAFPKTGVDLFVGSGGAPEGVIAAAGLKCLGGELQGRLLPENEAEFERCKRMGIEDPTRVLTLDDLVAGDDAIFAATGVTSGDILEEVRFLGDHLVETHSIVMRAKTKTLRFISSVHHLDHKPYVNKDNI
ncbi:fructose 1,6-bisphosphatase [Alkalihalobacillus alcalophilus ATCC 27647 = CGMCC 1.3604]|uniref:Fructose-1,6-bisphosphatase n=1 Tax=Alkalihalobacillus alcalophilus ATCC 27647 = CGMCC 1.3604 TaxID=1218173 RepID=A0A094YUF7_ALKAL|nr:class II fructose-bisphosphatase [Alkalihalobacillus alcalophilus]KGA97137.1 fructose 1,6-bisphosphatase [Alkalihalobacillus alcalophilus ATCC 27647 = CGMCC 1.3604]MED1560591.1 class II fructose-bisphosphatase [Alkalihalobacillus alcalophilus]THG89066.1 fructose 1,6-bisphosphatase [Alkalihalobacillus alcalophilus ATCC 27647 = CGMCC 1.3604]